MTLALRLAHAVTDFGPGQAGSSMKTANRGESAAVISIRSASQIHRMIVLVQMLKYVTQMLLKVRLQRRSKIEVVCATSATTVMVHRASCGNRAPNLNTSWRHRQRPPTARVKHTMETAELAK